MEQVQWNNVAAAPSIEAITLIRKLRWIGLAEEASRLQCASAVTNMSVTTKIRRQGVLAEIPYSTD